MCTAPYLILFYKAKCKQNVKLNDVDMDVVLLSVTLTVSFMAHPMERTLLCRLALVMYGIKEEIFFQLWHFFFKLLPWPFKYLDEE